MKSIDGEGKLLPRWVSGAWVWAGWRHTQWPRHHGISCRPLLSCLPSWSYSLCLPLCCPLLGLLRIQSWTQTLMVAEVGSLVLLRTSQGSAFSCCFTPGFRELLRLVLSLSHPSSELAVVVSKKVRCRLFLVFGSCNFFNMYNLFDLYIGARYWVTSWKTLSHNPLNKKCKEMDSVIWFFILILKIFNLKHTLKAYLTHL